MKNRLGYSILFIAEREGNNELFRNLNNNGFNIIEVENEAEILHSIKEKTPQVIILNIETKSYAMNILNVLRTIKEVAFVPKIVLSPITDIKTKVEILKFGICDYIVKPFDFEELLARLNCHLINSLYVNKIISENEKIRTTCIMDDVTGLYNRKYLMNRLVEEISRAARKGECLSFAIINMNNYDEIVNSFGEAAKNHVLKQVSMIIKQLVRLSDIVIRYGEKELAVLCPITNRSGLDTFLDRLMHKINDSVFEYNGEVIKFTVNIGAYTLESSDFNSFEQKISNVVTFAEEALKKAIELEGNRVEYYE